MRIGIIMGGFSAERHISVESGRNVYEKLASSGTYTPIPIFLTGSPLQHSLFILPIHILLKDSADDIHERLKHISTTTDNSTNWTEEPAIDSIIKKYVGSFTMQPTAITYQELAHLVDSVFIALHGRPGEDGTLQAILEQHGLPYNGSGVATTSLTIDKFTTNRFLHEHGIYVANQAVVTIDQWKNNTPATIETIEATFKYPFIVKPVDDGCSVAVFKIQNRNMFAAYAENIFRADSNQPTNLTQVLGLKPNAAFPNYQQFLVEDLIEKGTATHFLEITGGLLTHLDEQGNRQYEMFKPSEVVATGDILSLEEKFLAGEGQNITPARFHPDSTTNLAISTKVKEDLQKVAQLVNIEGYARIDAMVKIYPTHIETWIIEINTLPALTPATCIFHQCAINGYRPFDFIHAIIQYGYRKARVATI
ncbi:MAG: D-alanine--D-alanine ligase family protein [Candidatus Amoebophilus sp.]